jgi:hypothetical protein
MVVTSFKTDRKNAKMNGNDNGALFPEELSRRGESV